MSVFDEVLTDGVGVDEPELLVALQTALSEGMGFSEFIDFNKAVIAVLTETTGFAEAVLSDRGVLMFDRLQAADSLVANQMAHLVIAEDVGFLDGLFPSSIVLLTDSVSVSENLLHQLVVLLTDALGVGEIAIGNAQYRWSFSDTVALADNLRQFVGVDLQDVVGLASALSGSGMLREVLQDTVAMAEDVSPRLLLRVALGDTLDINHTETLQALYTGVLMDGVELSGAYLAPDGSFTTWAMNTRTAAVTEYQSYTFNSFAKIGNRYVGASDSGLFWLDGDDDAGVDIVARLKGGWLQFGGTHLSRLKAVYIATRNAAEFVLRIETGEGAVYDYAVDTRSMRSTKVRMGKGQRARYFSFELISTGADFDLDTLEFVPVVVQRRV